MKKPKIVWPERDANGKIIKCGRIDGVPFKTIWKRCEREANKYCDERWPEDREE